jgi:hypothetical protein
MKLPYIPVRANKEFKDNTGREASWTIEDIG